MSKLDDAGKKALISSEKLSPALQQNVASYLGVASSGASAAAATTASGAAATGAAGGFAAFTASVKGAAAGLATFLTTNPIGWAILVAAGTTAVLKVIDGLTESFEEASEKAANAAAEYQNTTSELSSLQSELDETSKRIDELKAKGPLSLVEQAELSKLEQQNSLLERQVELKQRLAGSQQVAAANAAAHAMQVKDFTTENFVDFDGQGHGTYVEGTERVDKLGKVRHETEKLNALEKDRVKIEEQLSELLKDGDITEPGFLGIGGGADYAQYMSLQNQLNDIDSQSNDLSTSIQQDLSEINTAYDAVHDEYGNVIGDNKEFAKSCEDLFKFVLSDADKAAQAEGKIATVLDSARFDGVKEMLTKVAADGSAPLGEAINGVSGLNEELQKAGISAEDFTSYILNLAAPEFGNTIEQIGQMASAFGSINAPDHIAGMRMAELRDFFSDKGPEDVKKFYDYVNKNGIDLSKWSMDDVVFNFDKVVNGADDAKNSLSELQKGYTSFATSVKDVQSVLSSQTAGQTLSVDDYDKLSDYAEALEYVNGGYQLNQEKVTELIKAKAEEQTALNNTNKALDQSKYLENAAEIERLTRALSEEEYGEYGTADAVQAHIASLRDENDSLRDNINQYNIMNASLEEATSAYQHWVNAQSATQSGQMFDGALKAIEKIKNTLTNSESDDYGRVGNEDYKAALEFIIPDKVSADGEEAIKKYLKSLDKYLTLDDKGNFNGLDIEAFCKDAVDKGLMVLEDDEFKVAGQTTMQDFADGMRVSLPFVQAIFGEMQEYGAEFDWGDEAVKTIGDLGVAAYEAKEHLSSLKEFSDMQIVLDASGFEDETAAVNELDKTISEMTTRRSKLSVDSTEYREAGDIIQYAVAQKNILEQPAVMKVDTSKIGGDLGRALSLLQEFQNTCDNIKIQESVGADTSEAEAKLDELTSKLQGIDVVADLKVDASSTDKIKQTIGNIDKKVILDVDPKIDKSAFGDVKPEDKTATVKYGTDTAAVDAYKKKSDDKQATVTFKPIHKLVDAYNPKNLQRTVTYTVRRRGSTGSTSQENGAHSLNGTAHAAGTARSDGDWGTAKGGKTLVGELGRRILRPRIAICV